MSRIFFGGAIEPEDIVLEKRSERSRKMKGCQGRCWRHAYVRRLWSVSLTVRHCMESILDKMSGGAVG